VSAAAIDATGRSIPDSTHYTRNRVTPFRCNYLFGWRWGESQIPIWSKAKVRRGARSLIMGARARIIANVRRYVYFSFVWFISSPLKLDRVEEWILWFFRDSLLEGLFWWAERKKMSKAPRAFDTNVYSKFEIVRLAKTWVLKSCAKGVENY